MLKKIIIGFLILISIAVTIGLYLFYKPGMNLQHEKPQITMDALQLINEYTVNEEVANAKYLNKIMEVHGRVHGISNDEKGMTNIDMAENNQPAMISCSMDSSANQNYKQIKAGDQIKIKGFCTGMLMDIILVKCVLVN